MKRLLKIVIVASLVFTLCFGTRVSAEDYHKMYDSPELIYETDMVFSVAKGGVDARTENGAEYDGRPYGDYSQIHTNVNNSGNNGRYTIHAVSGGAIAVGIQQTVGEGDIRNVNEDALGSSDVVEIILRDYSGIDYDKACDVAATYIAYNRGLELGYYNELWYIDWYALKYQQDGRTEGRIHIDGKVVEIEQEDEPEITPEVTPSPTPKKLEPIVRNTPTPTPTEAPTPTEEPTATPTPTEVPTATEAPTEMPIATPTPTPTPEPTATPVPTEVPTPTPTPTPIEEEEVELEVIETPEGTPDVEEGEEISIEEPETPEGAPEEEIEEEPIEIEVPEVPESDVEELPQTGVTDSVLFYFVGGWFVALGAILIKRRK